MKYILLISLIILGILGILITYKKYEKYDIVFSINVHEKYDFLLKQLNNIQKYVKCNYCIILNCNEYMYKLCSNNKLPKNVFVNNIILNKKRSHGSLTEGIFNNMIYALNNIHFEYFIVLSSRDVFYNDININIISQLAKNPIYLENNILRSTEKHEINKWKDHWPEIVKTKLSIYYLNNNKLLYMSPHEGLGFTYNSCETIVNFLKYNTEIKHDLFNYNDCVEEFGLQTIAVNEIDCNGYFYIGNGVWELDDNHLDINKYTRKIKRV